MKYSLRSLMIVVTLVCVLLGGRIGYLRQMAVYHEGEAKRIQGELTRKIETGAVRSKKWPDGSITLFDVEDARAIRIHSEMGKAFRQAVFRPWAFVEMPDGTFSL
jgi:hypothetical protein